MYFRFEVTDNGTVTKEFMPKTWRSFKRYVSIDYNYVNGNFDRKFKGYRRVFVLGWEQLTSLENTDLTYILDAIRTNLPVKITVIYRKVDINLDPIPAVDLPAGGSLVTFNTDEVSESEGDILEMLPMEIEFETKDIITE